jgi:hypothetical protein
VSRAGRAARGGAIAARSSAGGGGSARGVASKPSSAQLARRSSSLSTASASDRPSDGNAPSLMSRSTRLLVTRSTTSRLTSRPLAEKEQLRIATGSESLGTPSRHTPMLLGPRPARRSVSMALFKAAWAVLGENTTRTQGWSTLPQTLSSASTRADAHIRSSSTTVPRVRARTRFRSLLRTPTRRGAQRPAQVRDTASRWTPAGNVAR